MLQVVMWKVLFYKELIFQLIVSEDQRFVGNYVRVSLEIVFLYLKNCIFVYKYLQKIDIDVRK